VRVAFFGVIFALGCSPADTGVRFKVDRDVQAPPPSTLRLSMFGTGRLSTPRKISPVDLPGTLVMYEFDPATPNFRVLLDGLDANGNTTSQAATRVALVPHSMAPAALTLTAGKLPDGDGDGVPDVIDDCPTVYDPNQDCATPDGGATSDGGTVAPSDFGGVVNPASCPARALFCDDFESGGIGSWSGSRVSSASNLLTVDRQNVHSGKFALHATTVSVPNSGPSQSYVYYNWGGTPAPVALRLWLYVNSPLADDDTVAALYRQINGFAIGADGNGNWFVGEDQLASGNRSTSASIPMGRWTCVELVLQYGRAQLFLDDASTPALEFAPARPVPYDELHVGLEWVPSPGGSELWVDDVALAASRVHCN
jgi:hypothetical protein